MGRLHAPSIDAVMLASSVFALVTIHVAQATAVTTSSTPAKVKPSASYKAKPSSSTPTVLSLQERLEMLKKVLPDYGVFNQGTSMPFDESWKIDEWSAETVAPWLNPDGSFDSQFNPNVDADDFNIPTMKPFHFDFDDNDFHKHDDLFNANSSGMGSYTWITMAVVLVVFFKVTVIAVMIARRMRYRQHRVVVRSSNSNSVTVPSEFTSDQAHLVTPANIVYVDTVGAAPPPLPQMFTPPPYCESLLPNSQGGPTTPTEEPPPYSD
ncbi:uncharacterized protein LOC119735624 [Patiria miniata]|uniref:Transmembrane protein n=1 Tax=Patiria miniata TaxID=46514 RepID=A0A914APD5_PATMI|nr:uncharacterized protein LOC119735624 [Patiria miniata]XP_038065336.1 uncharacterized protein LOC119735624 [Patiria miniata]